MNLYITHDSKSQTYSLPFGSLNRQTAMRQMQSGLSGDSLMATYASDFTLYECAEFDQATGIVVPIPLHHVCELTDLIKEETPDESSQRLQT